MTQKEAAIISAYTGILLGKFSDVHEYAELKLGRSVWTHEFAVPEVMEKLKKLAYDDFVNISIQ